MSQRSTSGAGREAADARRAVPASTLRGLRLLEPDKPALYASPPRRVKSTHAANQMKRVQRANGSLAQSGARSPQRTPRGKHGKADMFTQNALCRAADSVLRVFRRDRRQKTRKPEVNQPPSMTAPTIRERATGDPDPRRNRNATSRKPSCLALRRQTAGVIERKTPRENRIARQTVPPRAQSPLPEL